MAKPNLAKPTMIGCPECAGVLSVAEEGQEGHIHYVCDVGHGFSLQSLLEAKENQLEVTMWAVVSLLRHVEMVCMEMTSRRGSEVAHALERRIQEVRAQQKTLIKLIQESEPPNMDRAARECGLPET